VIGGKRYRSFCKTEAAASSILSSLSASYKIDRGRISSMSFNHFAWKSSRILAPSHYEQCPSTL
jgi:hypothetical protein